MQNSEVAKFFKVVHRRWLAVLIVCAIGFGLMPVAALVIPAYKGTAEILIVSQALQKDTTLADPDLPSIITSTEVLNRVIKRLNLDTNPLKLAKKIKTKLPTKSSVLELTYKDTDPSRAVAVTNTVADESALYFHELATRGYTDVLQALNRGIADSRAEIAAADRRLQHASARNAFASSDKALDDLTTQIDELREQRGQYASSFAADKAAAAALEHQLRNISPIIRGEILQKDPVYAQLQAEFAKDVADLTSERSSFRESFPGLLALARRVDRERDQLKSAEIVAVRNGAGLSPSYTQTVLDEQRAQGVVAADSERLRATDAQLVAEKQHLQQVAGAGAVVGTLRAQRDAALQQYIALTQRLSTAQADSAQAVSLGSLVVVSHAVPGPSSLWLYLVGIGILVIALAAGIAYMVDTLDRRLWGIPEIENAYGRPVLIEVGGY